MADLSADSDGNLVRIAISEERLAELLDKRWLTVSDIHCLDPGSKRRVWRSCLEASLKNR